MRLRFLLAALSDIEQAAAYYDQAKPGHGDDLYNEIERALTYISGFRKLLR